MSSQSQEQRKNNIFQLTNPLKTSQLNRRHFIQLLSLSAFSLAFTGYVKPANAALNESYSQTIFEKYHLYLPYKTARYGGKQTFTLRSGESYQLTISPKTTENTEVIVKNRGIEGQNILVILHTLYDPFENTRADIYNEIDNTKLLEQESSPLRCKSTYSSLEDKQTFQDFSILSCLDYIINSSDLQEEIKTRYSIASQNARVEAIEQAIESSLEQSGLDPDTKKQIRGTYQYVKASEPVPNFKTLKELDTIVLESPDLLPELKQTYSLASATSRAVTVDLILIKAINENQEIDEETKENYLLVYQKIRDGQEVSKDEQATLEALNSFIKNSDISKNAKVVYSLAEDRFFDEDPEEAKSNFENAQEVSSKVRRVGAGVVPFSGNVLSALGAETATGVALSTLSGGAATNATLALLGGGSVASGGLGMLGGLAVATGGAALIGAAGLLSVALVSQMDQEDLANLGIASATGVLTGVAAVFVVWTGATALGVAGTLSGAAAISATISALGGLSVVTGGAAFIAFGTGFAIWSFLNERKQRDQKILNQLEARTYTLAEVNEPSKFIEFLEDNLPEKYELEEVFIVPEIPVNKIVNSMESYVDLKADEKILALVDTSIWDDAKEGIIFTNQRLIWKDAFKSSKEAEYSSLNILDIADASQGLYDEEETLKFSKLLYELSQNFTSLNASI